jgi:hypothetical protein
METASEEPKRRQQPARATGLAHQTGPAGAAQRKEHSEQQQRQESHAFGDHAETGRDATEETQPPGRPLQQMPSEGPQRQRAQREQRGIDLRATHRLHELQRAGQRQRCGKSRRASMQAPREIVNEDAGGEGREQRRQQERSAHRTEDRIRQRQQPEEHRRLVLVEIAADARNQPVAAGNHVTRETMRIAARRPATDRAAVAARDQQQHREQYPAEIAPVRARRPRRWHAQLASGIGLLAAGTDQVEVAQVDDEPRALPDDEHRDRACGSRRTTAPRRRAG